ncbi:MAG: carbon-nitrogen family hydrolase [Deltaproteobacteria bacterium]|nr:carbon-nitrogen family hydrolase [Deltaproteobacteria bacterium]MBN2674419.1 carbon-nitrogen family hydrolase [Deltaproteobacteria bacterium]
MTTVTVAAAQMDIGFERPERNYSSAARLAENAARRHADLFILPEMFATGFSMNTELVAEESSGRTPKFLESLASRYQMYVAASYVKIDVEGRMHNMGVVFDRDGRLIHEYAKIHLFSPGGESKAFCPGNTVPTFCINGVRFVLFICYDLRFPEIFRMVAKEVDAAVVVANWPGTRQEHWDCLLRARAIENQQYLVGVNRIGESDGLVYNGGSVVVSPGGQIIASCASAEDILVGKIDSSIVAETRQAFPVLADMRLGTGVER